MCRRIHRSLNLIFFFVNEGMLLTWNGKLWLSFRRSPAHLLGPACFYLKFNLWILIKCTECWKINDRSETFRTRKLVLDGCPYTRASLAVIVLCECQTAVSCSYLTFYNAPMTWTDKLQMSNTYIFGRGDYGFSDCKKNI